MARRRRRKAALTVSLFPFLSVLACVIGALTLLLAVTAIHRLGGPSLARIRLAEKLDGLEAAIRAGEARLEELSAQIHRSEARAREEAELGERLAALGLSLQIPLEELAELADLAREAARLAEERRSLAQKKQRLAAKASEREADLSERRAAQARAPIIIDPSGVGPEWRPYLIECTADYIELHQTSGDFSVRIPDEEIETSADYDRYLARARVIPRVILIFLIRPDGVKTFAKASRRADLSKVRNAKLPLPGDGELDFGRLADRPEAP